MSPSLGQTFRRGTLGPAFTLVELLVVIAIISVLVAVTVPALRSLKGGGDLTKAAYDVAGTLETARAYAMANNTYTWVGFYEESAASASATNATPGYPGKGRVLLAIVASKDGTAIVDDSDPASKSLDPLKIALVGKPLRIEGIHLADIGAPVPNASSSADSLDGRPAVPHDGTDSALNLVSSDNSQVTLRPFVAQVAGQSYTFYKTVRFSPRGEANIGESSANTAFQLRRMGEIGLRPTHGEAVDANTPNVVAIQFTGVGGAVKIYRR